MRAYDVILEDEVIDTVFRVDNSDADKLVSGFYLSEN